MAKDDEQNPPHLSPKELAAFRKNEGDRAKRAYTQVKRHTARLRDAWVHIGTSAAAVRDSFARNSGELTQWRERYLPEVSAPVLSNAMWCATHPKSIALVPPEVNHPTQIYKGFKDVAKDAIADFILHGGNDLEPLAEKLGLTMHEMRKLFATHAPRPPAPAREKAAVIDDDVASAFGHTEEDDSALDMRAMVQRAITKLDALDLQGARAALVEALKRK